MTDPLFAGLSRLPVLDAQCPACEHKYCGQCMSSFHTEKVGTNFINVRDHNNICCKCGNDSPVQYIDLQEKPE